MKCAKSVKLTHGMAREDTVYSTEGTAAHGVLQRRLSLDLEPVRLHR